MDRSSKQKINKEIKALNDTLDQMDITDIFRTFHPKATEYTFFSSAHGTFSRIDHILGHKSGLNWYQKIGIRAPGWLSGLKPLPLAQVMIPESWD